VIVIPTEYFAHDRARDLADVKGWRSSMAVVESYFDVAVRPQLPAGGDPFRAL
jgi:hypothetical protein